MLETCPQQLAGTGKIMHMRHTRHDMHRDVGGIGISPRFCTRVRAHIPLPDPDEHRYPDRSGFLPVISQTRVPTVSAPAHDFIRHSKRCTLFKYTHC